MNVISILSCDSPLCNRSTTRNCYKLFSIIIDINQKIKYFIAKANKKKYFYLKILTILLLYHIIALDKRFVLLKFSDRNPIEIRYKSDENPMKIRLNFFFIYFVIKNMSNCYFNISLKHTELFLFISYLTIPSFLIKLF